LSAFAPGAVITWDNGAATGEWNTTDANFGGTYSDSDDVVFDGSVAGDIFIGLLGVAADVAPGSTTFSGSSDYTFSGGALTAGNMSKSGTATVRFNLYDVSLGHADTDITEGTLIYALDNTFSQGATFGFGTGTITLDGGTFRTMLSGDNTTGSKLQYYIDNAITVTANNGELNVGREGKDHTAIFSGPIALGGELSFNADSGGGAQNSLNHGLSGTITIDQNAAGGRAVYRIGGHGNQDFTVSGNIVDGSGGAGNALRLHNKGGNTFFITGTGNTYAGGTIIEDSNNNVIEVDAASALGTGGVTIQNEGYVRLRAAANVAAGQTVTIEGGGKLAFGSAGMDFDRPIALTGNATLAALQVAAVSGSVDLGNHNLSVDGPTVLYLDPSSASNFGGDATVKGGGLHVAAMGGLPTGNLNLNDGVLVLDGSGSAAPSWSDLTSARSYGSGAGEWELNGGGFAAKGTKATILADNASNSAFGATTSYALFDRDFVLGARGEVSGTYWADASIEIAQNTTLTGSRNIFVAPTGKGLTGASGVEHVISGDIGDDAGGGNKGVVVVRGYNGSDDAIGELVLEGTNNWAGSAHLSGSTYKVNTGGGGMLIDGFGGNGNNDVFVRFGSPAALPSGATATAYLASIKTKYKSSAYRHGYLLTGSGGGQTYDLGARNLKFLFAGDGNHDHIQPGVLGVRGGKASLVNADVILHWKENNTSGSNWPRVRFQVDDGSQMALGSPGNPVRIIAAGGAGDAAGDIDSAATVFINPEKENNRRAVKGGAGTLVVENVDYTLWDGTANSSNTQWYVEVGTLLYNDTAATAFRDFNVYAGATLGGSGTIGMDAGRELFLDGNTAAEPATIAPGASIGLLSVFGDVDFHDDAWLVLETADLANLPGVSNDALGVSAYLDLTAGDDRLYIDYAEGASGLSGTYVLATYGTIGGEFNKVFLDGLEISDPTDSTDKNFLGTHWLDYNYDWDGQMSIVLTDGSEVVPEPATLALLALGALGILVRRRR
jgi:fibronectin-binding autotransporter adhesin